VEEAMQLPSAENPQEVPVPADVALNKRLERIAWGVFLILLGGLWLIPNRIIPDGAWLVAAGVVLLGLNLARRQMSLPISGFTTVLGVIALLSGLGDLIRFDLPVFPILLILVGAYLLLRPMLERAR
jgi:ethanolamine transporter EutH